MAHFRLEVDAIQSWGPLERLARICMWRPCLPEVRAEDFMYMGMLTSPDRPAVHMYKHIGTRRYLCIDAHGHAYATSGVGRWRERVIEAVPLNDLHTALALVFAECRGAATSVRAPT